MFPEKAKAAVCAGVCAGVCVQVCVRGGWGLGAGLAEGAWSKRRSCLATAATPLVLWVLLCVCSLSFALA